MSRLSSSYIPNFLEASSKKRLRSLMLKVAARQGGYVKFFDFSEQSDGKFICWYNEKIEELDVFKAQIEGD